MDGRGGGYRIVKFGGTSVEGPDRLDVIASQVRARIREGLRPVLVVSAFRGVTDDLIAAAAEAARGTSWSGSTSDLLARHVAALQELSLDRDITRRTGSVIGERIEELERLLRGIELVRECTPRTLDQVLSLGERLTAPIIAAGLAGLGLDVEPVDPRELVVTDASFGCARVDFDATRIAVRRHFAKRRRLQLVPGFAGATTAGQVTTLGRGGSDHTAAVLGAALDADEVEIWTDVDGVMSADPRVAPDAFPLARLSYDELMELSHWGAKVVHAPAVRALREHRIPVVIRNAGRPDFPGTRIDRGAAENVGPVKGIACVDDVSLLTLEGRGIAWAPHVLERLFGALRRAGGNPLIVSQASSEHAVCIGLDPARMDGVTHAVMEEFRLELRGGLLREPEVEMGYAIVAAVGEGMRDHPGVAGRLFSVLGNHGINVRAIAQGSSELNISAVVRGDDATLAVRAVHDAFFHPDPRRVHIYLAGAGRVGSALLDQLAPAASGAGPAKRHRMGVAGVATSDRCAVRRDGIDLDGLRSGADGGDPSNRWKGGIPSQSDALDTLVEAAIRDPHHPRVFVDCTASPDPVHAYRSLLDSGVSLVCANKLAFSGSTAAYDALTEGPDAAHRIFYETTVGAALPLVRTLADLARTGDTVETIEGVLSGSLGFILDRIDRGERFSDAVRDAHERGYTEPDPRDDLSGVDVLRKIVILARTVGVRLEPGEVDLQPLLSPAARWAELSLEDFWTRLPEVDGRLAERREAARSQGRRLAYLASLRDGHASVRLEEVGPDHPSWTLRSTDNMVVVTSTRYTDAPLVVRGPGAGPEVTASGVFADILRARAEAAEVAPSLRRPRRAGGGRDT